MNTNNVEKLKCNFLAVEYRIEANVSILFFILFFIFRLLFTYLCNFLAVEHRIKANVSKYVDVDIDVDIDVHHHKGIHHS